MGDPSVRFIEVKQSLEMAFLHRFLFLAKKPNQTKPELRQ
jgi:hypothetical protein